jgi:MscS family membrane protein
MLAIVFCLAATPVSAQAPLLRNVMSPGVGADSTKAAGTPTARRGGIRPEATRADSPRGAVAGYLVAARAGDYRRAANYLDLSELEGEDTTAARGTLLARQLKFVLDRMLWIDLDDVSENPDGDLQDGLPPDRERIGTISTRQGPVDIRMRRGEDPATGNKTWRFSPRLVERIPDLYREFGPGPIGARMPPALYTPRFLEIELWQWIALGLCVVVAYVLAVLLVRLTRMFLRFRAARRRKPFDEQLLITLRTQARLIVALGIFLLLSVFLLRLSIPARHVLLRIGEIFLIVLVTWGLMKIADGLWRGLRSRLEREERRSAMALALFGQRMTRVALVVLGAVVALQQIGFQITGLLAGLGVGGVAVALAAQKTIANLFGGFSLATDQPVRLGDFCRFGDKSGWVEDVGMRSTRIRTLDRSVITVPNSEFAEIQLENMSLRDRILLSANLGLRYETTPDQLRKVLAALHKLLADDSRVIQNPLRVRFKGFGAYSLDIEVLTYIATADFDEFMAIREELFLKMMDIVNESGTGFAFPSQTIYAAQDRVLGHPTAPAGR